MIRPFLTQFNKSYTMLLAFMLISFCTLQAQVAYNCSCNPALDDDVVEFRIRITGSAAGETWTLSSASNLFLSLNPLTPIPDGYVVQPTSSNPSIYEITGFAYNNVMPYVLVTAPNGITTDVNMLTCMRPVAEIIVAGGIEICAGVDVDLSLSVLSGNIVPTSVNDTTIVFTALGSASLMQNADGTAVVSYNTQGSFLIRVEGTSFSGCDFTGEIVVNVTDAAEGMAITGPCLLCTGDVTDISYSVSNPDGNGIIWDGFPDPVTFNPSVMGSTMTGSGSTVDATFPATAGTYTLVVSNSDPTGCAINGVTKEIEIVDVIDTVGIIGSNYLCLDETSAYTVASPSNYSNLQWSISPSAGTTIAPTGGVSDLIDLTIANAGTYTLTVSGNSADGCLIESTLEITAADDASTSIACNNTVNISLNNDCLLELDADVILEGENLSSDAYTLEIYDETADSILTSNMITQDQLGHTFRVTVMQRCGGNSCWGNLVVEDKSITPLAPFCSDQPAFSTCYNFDDTDNPPGFPDFDADVTVTYRASTQDWLLEGFDNCSDAVLTVTDDNTSTDVCSDPQTIERTFVATDINNGATSSCVVDVQVSLVDKTSIVWPPNYDTGLDAEGGDPTAMDTDNTFGSLNPCNTVGNPAAMDNTQLFCGTQWIADANGNPTPECTGTPTGLLCTNLQLIGYKDDEIPICGESKKILRRWTVWDACANEDVMYTQIITIMDTEKPQCSAPPETQAFTDLHECGATIFIDPPLITGECEETTYTIRYKLRDDRGLIPSEFISDGVVFDTQENKYKIVDLPFSSDTVWINYIVRDICGNENDECFNEIELLDNEQPIPACDLNNSVTLNDNGCAFATPGTFDDNSWDNCGIFENVIQKMDDRCDCQLARYDYLDYLGELNGHYYYLSKEKVHGARAFYFADAIEGYVATVNNAAENTWIRDQVNRFQNDEDYIIGLRGTDNGGDVVESSLVWQNGTSTHDNWAALEPRIDKNIKAMGDVHVFVNDDGTWDAERRNFQEAYYVIERNDKCGWSQQVKFCCEDVGKETMVALRVIDNFGNHNQCMVRVTVRDFIAPEITCPADVTIDCDDDIADVTSQPTTSDFCGGVTVTSVIGEDTFECGDDFVNISRTFTATDLGGNTSRCTQNVRKENRDPFNESDITWPDDHTFTNSICSLRDLDPEDLPNRSQEPVIRTNECSSIVFTYEDLLFTIVDGVCQKLVRTWTVVDWCQPTRRFTHDQVIKLVNEIGPQISSASCSTMTVDDGLQVSTCNVQVDGIVATLDDVSNNCGDDVLWSYTVILNGTTGTPDRTGNSNDASGVYPYGRHTITFTVEDECGNIDECTKTLIVLDNKPPTPYCLSEVVLPLSEDGTVEIWASDLDLGSGDDCPGTTVTPSFDSTSIVANLILDCDDLDPGSNFGNVTVRLYVHDEQGNVAFCTILIKLQDNRNVCDNVGTGSRVLIEGQIMTEEFEMVDEVEVSIMSNDPGFPLTDMADMGDYAFGDLDMLQDYRVDPLKDDDYLNGVSTLDLLVIQRHILGSAYLDSPYKVIAADIDNSQSITAIDLIELRKLILGIYDELPLNNSWRFVDADHTFTDVSNPFPYPENITIQNIVTDISDANFMGVKIGDVNGTVTANAQSTEIDARSGAGVDIVIQETDTEAGNKRLQFIADQDIELAGMQFALDITDKSQEILAVIPMALQISNDHIAWDRLSEGQIVLSWNDVTTYSIQEGEVLFEILVASDSKQTDVRLIDSPLRSEIYTISGDRIDVQNININQVGRDAKDFSFSVHQNVPNPFKDESIIEFVIPTDGAVELTITDQSGRLLYKEANTFEAGKNRIIVHADAINSSGVLYYQLSTDGYTATKKMIVLQ